MCMYVYMYFACLFRSYSSVWLLLLITLNTLNLLKVLNKFSRHILFLYFVLTSFLGCI